MSSAASSHSAFQPLPAPGRLTCITAFACCGLQAPQHLHNFQAGGKLDTFDIEELVAEGSKGCAPLSPNCAQLACHCGVVQPAPQAGWGVHCCTNLAAAELLPGQRLLCLALYTHHVQYSSLSRGLFRVTANLLQRLFKTGCHVAPLHATRRTVSASCCPMGC